MAVKPNPIGIDFFCGCGGMTAGLIKAGVEVRLGIDLDPLCEDTYERNNGVPFLCADIHDLTYVQIEQALKNKRKQPVVFAACAPCQPFSKVRKTGAQRHREASLMLEFLRFVLHFRPEYVLSENVPQFMTSERGKQIISTVLKSLKEAGYSMDHRIVNAADFGVPQHRLRLVLLASRDHHSIQIPEGPTKDTPPTVREAIADFPALRAGERLAKPHNHWVAALSEDNLRRIRSVPKNGGDLRSVPDSLRPHSRKRFGKYGNGSFYDVYGRMRWDAPAPTLTTRCNSYSNGRYGHPEQDRAISLREAAALQSFSGSYVFYVDSIHDGARLIGNAVPVSLAFHLTSVLLKS